VKLIKIVSAVSNDIVTDNRVNKIARSLEANGYKVTIVGRRLHNSSNLLNRPYDTKRFRLLFNKGPLFYVNLNLRLFFHLIFSDYGFFLANDLDTLPACWLASRIRHRKLIFDSHELFSEVPELVARPIVRKIWKRLEIFLVPRINLGFTVSAPIAEFYKKNYHVHFEVLKNAGYFRFDYEFEGFAKDTEVTTIIYQGSLNMGRGLDLAIRSMQYIENAKLWIIGTGDVEHELKKLVSELSLGNKVVFTGRIAMEDLWKYTFKADIGISPEEDLGLNYRYGLPNKLFDYIQARIPVIVSDLPQMKAVVENYKIGKVLKERSPQILAGVLNEMIKKELPSGKYNANLGLAARELCWEREEEKLIDSFKHISEES
jgi:glycosyltransferase involved in cell wall biosynthesis